MSALHDSGYVLYESGNVAKMMDEAETTIESDYVAPYLSHACLEPMNCTVEFSDAGVDVWVGVQDPEAAVAAASEVSGLPAESVRLHNCFMGGGFGRRSQVDFVKEAVLIAKEVDKPVQMIWTREEDQRAGQYRPMSASRFKAGFDIDKNVVSYTNHSVVHSIASDRQPGVRGIDETSVEGLLDMPYRIDHKRISHTSRNTNLTSWYWRSRGHSQNAYAMECFVDEMAVAAKQNPLSYRRHLLRGKTEMTEVLDVLRDKADWGRRLPPGSAQGVAIHESFGTVCGQVAEVTVSESGDLSVNRIVCVIDCGNLINPTTAEMQVESAIIFGLSAALFGKLTVENGIVLEDNYDSYHVIRMSDAPIIETHFALSGGDKWGGLGEPATPPVAPAVCNALYQITGRRIRALPIQDYLLTRRR